MLTYVSIGVLVMISGVGLWLWTQNMDAQTNLFMLFLLCGLPLGLLIFVVARAALGVGQSLSSSGFLSQIDQLHKRLNGQDDLIRSITDYAPAAMMIFNQKNEYWFVNAGAAESLGVSGDSLLGKTPVSLLGADRGRKIERNLDAVRQGGRPLDVLSHDLDGAGRPRYLQTCYQPMQPIGDFSGGVIAREENVTKIIVERERHENTLRQIIATLVAVVDRRDPYAAGHSARVGMLSRAIAGEMQLNESEIEAAEYAGSLMNFGKVLVSRSILTKIGALTHDELQRIRDGILTSADILSLIDFGAPVVPTLRQVLERVDGTGEPAHLRGDAILLTARIVAVANAYVALVSPRAYRPGIDLLAATEKLEQDVGKAFDGRVIAALSSYLRKNIDKVGWLTVVRST